MMARNVKIWQSPRARYPVETLTRLEVPFIQNLTSQLLLPSSVTIIKS